mgnify:CR=1 FL=1
MWIKLLGICLVCVSCAGIGGGEALRLIGRRRFLEEVKRIAAGLQGEIGYTQAVLPLALCRAGHAGIEKRENYFWWQESGWKRIQSVRLGVSGKRFWKSRGFVRC